MKVLELESQSQLIRCPRCKGVIDAQSRECRFCRRSLSSADLRTAAELYREDQQKKAAENDRRTRKLAILGAIGILAMVFLKILEMYLPPLLKKSNYDLALLAVVALGFLGSWVHRRTGNNS